MWGSGSFPLPKWEGQGLEVVLSWATSGRESCLCDLTFLPQLCALRTLPGKWRRPPKRGGGPQGSQQPRPRWDGASPFIWRVAFFLRCWGCPWPSQLIRLLNLPQLRFGERRNQPEVYWFLSIGRENSVFHDLEPHCQPACSESLSPSCAVGCLVDKGQSLVASSPLSLFPSTFPMYSVPDSHWSYLLSSVLREGNKVNCEPPSLGACSPLSRVV